MPDLESFVGKKKSNEPNWDGWSKYIGTFGCQKCTLDVDTAYFNPETAQIKWVCSDNHESVIQLD